MVSLPSDCFTRFGNPAWPGIRTANFAAFGSWSEALLKNAESLRDSDALMRVAVPRRRGPAGLRALATAALYLVLKSNGLRHSKNLPVKFGFSPRTVPANIAKKLPLQLRPKPLFIAFFNFSHKRPTFAFTPESGYTLAFQRKIAHKGTHAETGVFWMGVVSLPSDRFARIGNLAWPGG